MIFDIGVLECESVRMRECARPSPEYRVRCGKTARANEKIERGGEASF